MSTQIKKIKVTIKGNSSTIFTDYGLFQSLSFRELKKKRGRK